MRAGYLLLLLALGLLQANGTPLKGSSFSLPLHRHFSLYEGDDVQGPLPVKANGIESLVYTVDVKVGSQSFNLTIDTVSSWSILFEKGFVASNRSCSKGDARRNLFDPSLSKTFKATGGVFTGMYLFEYPYVGLECHQTVGDGQFDGIWGQDMYEFGSLSVPAVPFVLSNHTYYPLNPRWASDGVLPLDYGSAIQTFLDAFGGSQEVSLFLNNVKPSANQPVPGGRITFGSKNTHDCSSRWVSHPTSAENDWSLTLNSLNIGTRSISSGDYAEISTSTPFLEVPSWLFRVAVNALGGTFSSDLDLYTVDCSKLDSLPAISISLGSGFAHNYGVKAQDYVAKINGKNGVQCALLIVQGRWTIGTQFLPKRCVHLDYANARIGFADPRN